MSELEWDDTGEVERGPAVPRDQRNAIVHDALDRFSWNVLQDTTPQLGKHMTELAADYPTSPEAYEDLFNILHQGAPDLVAEARMEEEYRPQHPMLAGISESGPVEGLRKFTVHDDYNTAATLLALQDEIREAFEQLDQGDPAQPAGGEGEAGASEESANVDPSEIADAVAAAIASIAEQLKDESEAASSFGIGDGELRRMPFEERRALMKRLQGSKIRKLGHLLGAFRNAGEGVRRRRLRARIGERFDVTQGRDVGSLTSSEQLKMAVPELEDAFWVRWAQHSLQQSEMLGEDTGDRGPIIVVCDESGSMDTRSGTTGHTREAWSKAVTLALCDQARREGRDLTYIGFSHDMWERTFKRGQISPSALVELTEHFFAGGTAYEGPLTRALEVGEQYARRGASRPDVVFITDDECRVRQEFVDSWNSRRAAMQMRCYGIAVGDLSQGYRGQMREIADNCLGVDKLVPTEIAALFRDM